MTFPLEMLSSVSVDNPVSYLVFALVGVAFGYTLESAGFGDSRKLAAQFYFREFTVLKVMFTAIAVASVLLFGAVGLGILDLHLIWVNPTYLGSGIVGGLIMGVGFIIGGFCPTTSLASSSTGRIDGMMFMAGGFVGAAFFAETELQFDYWHNNAGYLGRFTLDQLFGLPAPVIVLIIVLVAILAFWGAEQLERINGKKDLRNEPGLRKVGAVVLAAAAVGVVMIGSPTLEDNYQKLTFKRTETVASKDNGKADHVTHEYSADEMLAKRLAFVSPAEAFKVQYQQSLKPVYLDVRNEIDFNLYHLDGAEHVPMERLPDVVQKLLAEPPSNTVFITMSNDEKAAVQAWKHLVASGVQNVYVLEGGVNNWIETFGETDNLQKIVSAVEGDDQLHYVFDAVLGDRYASCAPSPIENEALKFTPRIVMQIRRDKSGGGCG